jgi:hypothetical protein
MIFARFGDKKQTRWQNMAEIPRLILVSHKNFICARCFISKPKAKMINISIQRSVYPSILKQAKVISVFETGDVTESDLNYKPISLLSNLG